MSDSPFFSVVVPAHNCVRWIGECLSSVLAQTFGDYEVIVVNDGSTDDTRAELARFEADPRVEIIGQENAGPSAARNAAMEKARGQWAAFIDSDDRWLPRHLEQLADAISRHPGANLVFDEAMVIDERGARVKPKPCPYPETAAFADILLANHVTTSAAAARLESVIELGGFPPSITRGEDWDLWLRLTRDKPAIHVEKTGIEYRRHQDGLVHHPGLSMRDDNLAVIARARAMAPGLPADLFRRARANAYIESGERLLAALDVRGARAELISALREWPAMPKAWPLLMLSLGGPAVVRSVLGLRRSFESGGQTPGDEEGQRCRVVHVITDSGAGGAEKTLFELVTGLRHGGFEQTVITMKPKGSTARRIEEQGILVHSLCLPRKLGARYALALPLAFARLLAIIREERPHILHCWLFQANIAGRVAAAIMGVPVNISSLRVMEVEKTGQHRIDRLTSPLVTRYVAVCGDVARHHAKMTGLSTRRYAVIMNGIEPDVFNGADGEALRAELGLSRDDKVVAGLGRLHRQKGFDLLIEAMPGLLRRAPQAALLIAGDGPEREKLERLAAEKTPRGRVRFLGEWSRTPELLALADVFALPSRWEGMSNAVLEAMAAGRPVVAADVSGVRETLIGGGGDCGIVVPPEDPAALESALAELLAGRERARAMGARGREIVARRFPLERVIEEHRSLYIELLREWLGERTRAGR